MKKIPEKHETVKVTLKTASLDKGIVPVVKWLASFDSVTTEYSCEGSESDGGYVIFYCSSLSDLREIWRASQFCASIKLDFVDDFQNMRFILVFESKKNRLTFLTYTLSTISLSDQSTGV